MNTKTATVRARVESRLKKDAETILQKLGLTTSQAITIFLKQIALKNGIPFDIKIPNETTQSSLIDAKQRKGLKSHKNTSELYKELGI